MHIDVTRASCGMNSPALMPSSIALIRIREVELGPYLPVSISYVALPRYETGKAVAELALALSRGEEITQEVIKLPVTLAPHQSA
jgi:DNA-binding LacI/PurR family transcriptional regulator